MPGFKKVLYAHHFGKTGEKDVAGVVRRCREGGFNVFAIKAYDGTGLTGAQGLDSHPLAPHSLGDISRLYDAFGDQGIRYMPYGVSRGRDWRAEANLAIA